MRHADRDSAKGRRVLYVGHGDENRASTRYRAYNWIPFLKDKGFTTEIIPCFVRHYGRLPHYFRALMQRIRLRTQTFPAILQAAKAADIVVVQEMLLPRKIVSSIKQSGKRLVYDFSDPLCHLSPEHKSASRRWLHENIDVPRFNWLVSQSHHVVCENEILAERVRQSNVNVTVMPGPIDIDRFKPRSSPAKKGIVSLGWIGSPSTYPLLEPILPVLDRVAKECENLRLVLVGSKVVPQLRHLRVESCRWSESTEGEIVGGFDIGLNYSPMNSFTRLRGGSKILAYFAAGVPVVCSSAGIGDQVMQSDCGFLADSPDEWFDALLKLARSSELRRSMGQSARQVAIAKYSYQAHLDGYLQALQGAKQATTTRLANVA